MSRPTYTDTHHRTAHSYWPHRRSSLALSCRYFASRPDLLSRIDDAGTGTAASEPTSSGTAITAAAQRAITSNPAAASHLLAAGLHHANGGAGSANNNGHVAAAAQRAITKNPAATSRLLMAGINHANNSNPSASTAAGNNDHAAAFNPGRVAAAAHAFSGPPKSTSPPAAQSASKLVPQKVSSVRLL